MRKIYIYDIETYMNFFCAVFKHGDEVKVFEISGRKNDYEELISFYNEKNIKYAIGFNNVRFDGQVLQEMISKYSKYSLMRGSELSKEIYKFAQETIRKSNENEFAKYPEWKITVPQLDLFLMNHYNNVAKASSLKWLEFAIRYHKVQDLPFNHSRTLKPENYDIVIDYCINDVSATRTLAERCRSLIELRLDQHKKYPDLRLTNKSDSSIGEALFLQFMSEEMGVDKKQLSEMRTERYSLDVKDILLPFINFKTPEFQKVLEFYKNSTWNYHSKIGTSVEYKGIKYVFGEGGLHSSWENKIFEADDEYEIIDLDVKMWRPYMVTCM